MPASERSSLRLRMTPVFLVALTVCALAAGAAADEQAKPEDPLPPALSAKMHEAFRLYQFNRFGRGTSESACQVFSALTALVSELQPLFQEFAETHEAVEVDAFARRLKRRLPVVRVDLGRHYRLGATLSVDFATLAEDVGRGEDRDLLRALDRFEHGPLAEFGRPVFVRNGDCSAAYWCDSVQAAALPLRDLVAAKGAQPCLTALVRARVAPALAELAATRCVCEKRPEVDRAMPALLDSMDAGWPGLSTALARSLLAPETRYFCNRCGVAPAK